LKRPFVHSLQADGGTKRNRAAPSRSVSLLFSSRLCNRYLRKEEHQADETSDFQSHLQPTEQPDHVIKRRYSTKQIKVQHWQNSKPFGYWSLCFPLDFLRNAAYSCFKYLCTAAIADKLSINLATWVIKIKHDIGKIQKI